MGNVRARSLLLVLAGTVALAILGLTWAVGTGSSQTLQGAMQNCPLQGSWALSVWAGDDGTPTEQALATCTETTVAAAYWIDPQTQVWMRYFAGRPDLTSLASLNNMQGVLALLGDDAPRF